MAVVGFVFLVAAFAASLAAAVALVAGGVQLVGPAFSDYALLLLAHVGFGPADSTDEEA